MKYKYHKYGNVSKKSHKAPDATEYVPTYEGIADNTGALYAKYNYDVWDNPVSVTNASGVEITSPTDIANIQPLRYRSYYYDSDTGFYYLQSRYYDPVTHRFINADDVDIPELSGSNVYNKNLFSYCDNNPALY